MGLSTAINAAARTTERNPTDAQKESGNYAKGKVRLHGLEIAIENPKGGKRAGVDRGGKAWSVTMPAHYGYVKGTEGKDGDHVDVYVGPQPESESVWVVDQVDASSGKFDEHKCLLGYVTKADALADYKKAFSDGKGGDRIGGVTQLSMGGFKDWLRNGNTKKPIMAKKTGGLADAARRGYFGGGRVGYDNGGVASPFGPRAGLTAEYAPHETMADDSPDVLAREPQRPRGRYGFDGPAVTPGWREALGAMLNETADNPHIPALMMGISNIIGGGRSLTDDNPDMLHKLAGLTQLATGTLTPASWVRPAAKALDPLWNTWPRYAATYGLLGAPRAAEAVRDEVTERRGYDVGGEIPLSDSGPLPGQEWGSGSDPESGARFLSMLRDGAVGTAKALAPPMPRWPGSREEALEMIGEPKSLGQFAVEEGIPSAVSAFAPGLGRIPAVRSAVRSVVERPLASLLTAGGLGSAAAVAATDSKAQEAKEEEWNPETAKGPYKGKKRNSIETKGIQERAAALGLYPADKIDGVDSGGTRAAEWELIKRERNEASKQRLIEQEAATRATQATTAAEAEKNKKIEDERKAAARTKGLEDFEKAKNDPKNEGWLTPNVGYGLGIGVGTGLAGLVSYAFDRRAKGVMNAANKLIEGVGLKGKGAPTLSQNIASLNDFARKGGAGVQPTPKGQSAPAKPTDTVPFTRAPKSDPPWKENPKAMEASKLYPPRSYGGEYLTQGALVGSGLTEMGVGMWMSGKAHDRLKQAEAAVKENPDATTIAAYLDARNSANMWDSIDNMGRTWAASQATGAKLAPLFTGERRPDIARYEGLLGDTSKKLRTQTKKAKEYEKQTADEKAAKEQLKKERAEARAAKKKSAQAGPAAGAATLAGGSQLLGDRPEFQGYASPDSTLLNSLEAEGLRSSGGSVDKHHSHYQPRDRKTGRYAGGPVFPQHGEDTEHRQDRPRLASSDMAMQYADGGSAGKGAGYPYHAPDYSGKGDPATNDLVFAQRKRRDNGGRAVEIEAPQPDYTYGKPRWPNLDPRAYVDRPTLNRYANEDDLSRAKEAAISALPAMLASVGLRDRAMSSVKEADAMRAYEKALFGEGRNHMPYDFGIRGGQPHPTGSLRGGRSFRDSSMDLYTRRGVGNAEYNSATQPYRPEAGPRPANDYLPQGWSIAKQEGGAVAGAIRGPDGGRDDTRPIDVKSGSFVVPAETVAFLGGHNTDAGFKVLDNVFGGGGTARSHGGATDSGHNVPIHISDGEYVLSPEQVARVGGGDVERGHKLLDQMVMRLRKQHIDTLAKLPAPAKD